MMPKRSFNSKDIISLLSQLKDETPEYPASLLDARKAAFLKHATTLNIQSKGQGGEGGGEGGSGGSGGSGGALSGGSAQGILLQALIGFSLIAALLLTVTAYREKISEILRDNDITPVGEVTGETLMAPGLSTPTPFATVTPVFSPSPTQGLPSGTPTGQIDNPLIGTPLVGGTPPVAGTPKGTKSNPGLHLGQTPGTPAAPGHGNPGNVNKPDKPDKPEKPEKPPKPPKNK